VIGKSLGPYNIIDSLGAGGMSEVYLAVVVNWFEDLKKLVPGR